jgi:hypothetical protein
MSCPFGIIEVGKVGLAQKQRLEFDKLVGYLKVSFSLLPDYRRGFNSSYNIQDALSVFHAKLLFFIEPKKDAGNKG